MGMKMSTNCCLRCAGSGKVKVLRFGHYRLITCPICNGIKVEPSKNVCRKCDGSGKIGKTATMFGAWVRTCTTCYGKDT